jgi:hypothetical protein
MVAKVFISYRREDSAGHAGRVHDRLEREFGSDLLFMDVDSIPLGANFTKVLRDEVAKCEVLLAVIGPNWLTAHDEKGQRRLDNPNDFVRIEIAAALQRDVTVIPILLDGAKIPKADQLPVDLGELALRHGLEIRHASFHLDMDKLIRGLKGADEKAEAAAQEAQAQRHAQEQRRRHDEEAKRRAEVEAQRKRAEAETLARAEAERHKRIEAQRTAEEARQKKEESEARRATADHEKQADAKRKSDEEKAYVTAWRADTVSAVESFLAAFPHGELAAEGEKLRAELLRRDAELRHAMASDDPAVLTAFIETYPDGAQSKQVRSRLWLLQPRQRVKISHPNTVGALLVLQGIVHAAFSIAWFLTRQGPAVTLAIVVWLPLAGLGIAMGVAIAKGLAWRRPLARGGMLLCVLGALSDFAPLALIALVIIMVGLSPADARAVVAEVAATATFGLVVYGLGFLYLYRGYRAYPPPAVTAI